MCRQLLPLDRRSNTAFKSMLFRRLKRSHRQRAWAFSAKSNAVEQAACRTTSWAFEIASRAGQSITELTVNSKRRQWRLCGASPSMSLRSMNKRQPCSLKHWLFQALSKLVQSFARNLGQGCLFRSQSPGDLAAVRFLFWTRTGTGASGSAEQTERLPCDQRSLIRQ